jgi:hypothetical protein
MAVTHYTTAKGKTGWQVRGRTADGTNYNRRFASRAIADAYERLMTAERFAARYPNLLSAAQEAAEMRRAFRRAFK